MAHDAFLGEVTLAFLGFLSKNVTFERLLVSDLTGAGYFEALLGTRVRFDLWHFECFCCTTLMAAPHRRDTYGAGWAIFLGKECKGIKKTATSAVFYEF